jgi:hypothetical protein
VATNLQLHADIFKVFMKDGAHANFANRIPFLKRIFPVGKKGKGKVVPVLN